MNVLHEMRRGAQRLLYAAIAAWGRGDDNHVKEKTLGCGRPRSADQGANLEIGRVVVEIRHALVKQFLR
jgi:hypothetical protein